MALREIEVLGVNRRHLIGGFCFGFSFGFTVLMGLLGFKKMKYMFFQKKIMKRK